MVMIMSKMKKFCPLLKKMLSGEHDADMEYKALAKSTENQKIKNVISKIQRDERKHFKMLKKMYNIKCKVK